MQDVTQLHREAMELADRAHLARLRGESDVAKRAFHDAFEKERRAAELVATQLGLEPTRSVLHRSAASLALQCSETAQAERLIATALSGTPPAEIAEELRDLLEQVYFERHLSLRGVVLQPHEFQLSLTGDAVGPGIALSDVFAQRVKDLENLVYRTAERTRGKPFRERGRRDKSIEKEVELYVSAPRVASFAVSFRIGQRHQLELPGIALGTELIVELFECLELFSLARIEPLKVRITDTSYLTNFLGLARQIAPDGKAIRTVGLTSAIGELQRRVVLSMPREECLQPEMVNPEEEGVQRAEVRGVLRFADATREERGQIRLVDEAGKKHTVRVPLALMADIVRPMFDYDVIVHGRKRKGVIELESIDRAES